jgi:predicted hydrocarbon binding protein
MASSLWSHHYDTGGLVATREGDGVRVRITDFLWPHRTHCMSVGGWIEGSLELGRPKRAQVRELSCRTRGQETCEFALAWGA